MKTDYTLMIDDYLNGELDDDRLSEFEKTLQMDENLALEVDFQREIFEAIRDENKMKLRETLNEIHENSGKTISINLYSWKVQAVAATIALFLLIGGGFTINLFNTTSANQALYAEYFNPEDALLTVRSDATTYTAIEEGMVLYVQEQYELAIKTFNTVPENLIGKLYTGFSFMKLEEFEKAEVHFLEIIQDHDNLFVDQAEWNLGLSYLASGKETDAKALFTKIANGNTIYNGKAKKILLKMGKNN